MNKGFFSNSMPGYTEMVLAGTAALASYSRRAIAALGGDTIRIETVRHREDVFFYVSTVKGGFDLKT
ncbi:MULTISPECIES: hypothetical protein [Ensifer]|uniref:hypothetical protein n=1 Tax=Ensifer TaxID=106591 RepID=UPI000DC450D8|nr:MULTISPECIES: hypothetical protein [Ensifer]MCY1745254.1 hypothetical protein [Ensifer sp. SL37]RAR99277.1 hypothetical protein DEU52_15021 [Ensifer adhaerens]